MGPMGIYLKIILEYQGIYVKFHIREYHNLLRDFVMNQTLIDDVTNDYRTLNILAFNFDLHEELREGLSKLMESGENSMDIYSENEDDD